MKYLTASNRRYTSSFAVPVEQKKYFFILAVMFFLSLLFAILLIMYKNPVLPSSPAFIPVVQRRIDAVIAMALAALCQGLATVTFQSITNNRIITPSLLGFEALYGLINTGMIFFLGAAAYVHMDGIFLFAVQIVLMLLFSGLIYGTLLKNGVRDIYFILLIGIVAGQGLRSASAFMRRILSPSDFDVLQAKMFASVNNASSEYYVLAVPLALFAAVLLFFRVRELNIVSLGADVAQNLGVSHRFYALFFLALISILMAVSTALVGSLSFYGFLLAALAYRMAPTFDHRYILPLAVILGFLIMTAAYFFMYHVFAANGVVSIIIELFGGLFFIIMLLRSKNG